MCRLKRKRKNNQIQLVLKKMLKVKTLKEGHPIKEEEKGEIRIIKNSLIKILKIPMMMKKTVFSFKKVKINKKRDLKILTKMKKIYQN